MTSSNRVASYDADRPAIAQCVVGDTLCHVRVLSEAQWEAMAPGDRPATAEHFPGLGWVVATPGRLKPPPHGRKGLI